MSSNLSTASVTTFTYKDLLLKKLYYPIICSVLTQIVILQFYLFVANLDLLHPVQWICSTLDTLTYFGTWFFMICFLAVVFVQCLVCAKDYVISSTYCKNRFQKLVSVFSVHNFVLLTLHVLIGGSLVWLFLSLGGGPYQNLLYSCRYQNYCMNEGKFFLMLGGFWLGFYYFIKIYVSGKHLVFPIIQQRKLIQFKARLIPLVRESIIQSSWPTLYFMLFYYCWGSQVRNSFLNFFKLSQEEFDQTIFWMYFSSWLLGTLYFLSMNLMRFFFNLFITEPVSFPLMKSSENILTLQEAVLMEDLPIVQNLACKDLLLLSRYSAYRRQIVFTLSQPGGHPHNWNALITNVLKLFTSYTDLLNKSSETMMVTEKVIPPAANISCIDTVQYKSPERYGNLRNMSIYCSPGVVNLTSNLSYNSPTQVHETSSFMKTVKEKFNTFKSIWKIILGINYLFGELPQVNIQKCLANGYVIIWMSQGISELSVCSLKEDHYGVVQKDLPVLLTALVHLRQSMEKLNKIPALSKRIAGSEDFNYKMKNAILSAIKRSLFNLCVHFGEYIDDFPISKDTLQQLQPYVVCAKRRD